MSEKIVEYIYKATLFFVRAVALNIIWIMLTLVGLGIFGIIPATISVVTVFRKWEISEDEFNWIHLVWKTYVDAFMKCLLVSFSFFLILVCLLLSLVTLGQSSIILYCLINFTIFYMVFLFIPFFAVNYSHMDITIRELVRNAIFLPVMWAGLTFKIIILYGGIFILMNLIPGLIPIISISITLCLISSFLLKKWNNIILSRREENL